jgi:HemY protein
MVGDIASAKQVFQQLALDRSSDVLGYRGLIMLARRQKDGAEAERLIDKLYQQKPQTPWLCLMRFDVLVQQHRWNDAHVMLAQVATAQLQDAQHIRGQRAALLVASSQQAAEKGWANEALQLAERAMKQKPNWLPAIINLAQRQMDAGHKRATRRTIEKYWDKFPHPHLMMAYTTNQNPLDAYKFIEKLSRHHADNPLSHLVMAEAAFAADLWGEARRCLIKLTSTHDATQAAYRLLAKVERRERGDETAATQWLVKAGDAHADHAWLCSQCNGHHAAWQATCQHCHNFNALDWRRPGLSLALPDVTMPKKLPLQQIDWHDTMLS